jgi:hypothetical protein
MKSAISLTTGQNIRFTPQGLIIDGEMTLEQWTEFLNTIHSIKSAYHCVLADHLNYGRNKFGIAAVAIALEQAEFDLADVLKAEAIGQLDFDFRDTHQLNSEHYFILSKLSDDKDRTRWAKITAKEKLTPLELKRSIESGKVLRAEQIQDTSGQGSGLLTIQGALFKMQQWHVKMGGTESILKLPHQDRQDLLKLLTPAIELAAALEESLDNA